MKINMRLVALFTAAVALAAGFYIVQQASAPESSIIAREKKRIAASFDKSRVEKDPVYAIEFQDKLQVLDYRLAMAYKSEDKPDAAIAVLQKLIADEEGGSSQGGVRRSASYLKEVRYYDALQALYGMKHDEATAERAMERRNDLMARAEAAKRRERMEEGKSIGVGGE
ncbi:MAG TPA: hypothetical protein VL197_05445 [Nitrospirota bacterium]|nr:hypothetical protein [Nitrospirota bacterium]